MERNRKTSFGKGKRAQVSAEMIVLIAAVLAVAVILVSQMQATAQKGAAAVGNRTDQLMDMIGAKMPAGVSCDRNSQCQSGNCTGSPKVCR